MVQGKQKKPSQAKIRVHTSDNKTVGYFDLATIKVSESLKKLLEGQDMKKLKKVGILADRELPVVRKVFEWMLHYKDQPEERPINRNPLVDYKKEIQRLSDNISEWDQQFFDVERSILFGIIEAANFFGIQPLLYTAFNTVVHKMIEGKTREQIDALGIGDVSDEEKNRNPNQCQWFIIESRDTTT